MKVKRLTRDVALTFTDAEVEDLMNVLRRTENLRLLSKRERVLFEKLSGIVETIVGRRTLALTDEQRASPTYAAAAQAVRGLWSTVKV